MNTQESNLAVPQVKKPYAKPAIVYKEPLEAMAAACTPVGPGMGKASSGSPDLCGTLFS
jgi:hypothetical protein